MTRKPWYIAAVLIGAALCGGAACRNAAPVNTVAAAPAYAPEATIKDIMDAIVDPSADVVWNSVMTTVAANGVEDKRPTTDDEWAEVRRGAIRLVEASNLLIMPGRHMARPGEKSETPGIELEPHEMEALVNQDRPGWNARAARLHEVSLEVLKAIDDKDADKMFEVGDALDTACENCHKQYWYPNEKIPAFPTGPLNGAKG